VGKFPTWVQPASDLSKSTHALIMGLQREMSLTAFFSYDEIPSFR
jgi:hypothetical protein